MVFTNNIIFNHPSSSACIEIDPSAVNSASDYNCLYGTPNVGMYTGGGVTFPQWKGLGFDVHSITNNPLFVNATNGDFHLQSNSPAIGAGVNLSALFTGDLAGNTRPRTGAWDIGAHELVLGTSHHQRRSSLSNDEYRCDHLDD